MKSSILRAASGCFLSLSLVFAASALLTSPDAAAQGICETDEGRFYGPVRPGQNLWRISESTAPADTATVRMAAAIRRINPRAFVGGDASHLRTCVFLRLPERRDLRRVSADDVTRILSP